MKMQFASVVIMFLVAAIFTSAFPPICPAYAAFRIYLQPSVNNYDTNTAFVGKLFDVTVWVEDVAGDGVTAGAGAWQLCLEFKDDYLRVTAWDQLGADAANLFAGKTVNNNPTPPDPGYVHLGPNKGRIQVASNLFPTPPTQPPSAGAGPFKLCKLTFNITKLPEKLGAPLTSDLEINTVGTYLLDENGDEAPGLTKENGSYMMALAGNRIVSGNEYWNDTTVVLNENLTVVAGGNLTLDHVTLKMNVTYDGQYHIDVQGGGAMYIYNSTITDGDTDNDAAPWDSPENNRYMFLVRKEAEFEMKNSELHECGFLTDINPGIHPSTWCTRGLYIEADNPIIENNLISHNFQGIFLHSVTGGRLVRNKVDNNSRGICLHTCDHITLVGNSVSNNYGTGQMVDASDYNVFDSCVVEGNSEAPHECGSFYLWDSDHNLITNCTINESKRRGLLVIGGCLYNTIRSCTINGNGWEGVYLADSSFHNIIEDCIINSNTLYGIGICTLPLKDDICFLYGQCDIIDCTITNNGNSSYGGGIGFGGESSSAIANCTITHNSGIAGIQCLWDSLSNITHCTISNNYGDGIYCENSSSSIISMNNIFDNTGYGVRNSDPTVTVDAERNWWGDPNGPSGVGSGTGDGVSDYIDYDPWLHHPAISPKGRHLDANPPRLIDLSNPVSTEWDELCPYYGRKCHLSDWHDTNLNGKLDPYDFIDLSDEDLCPIQGNFVPYWWHVDDMTVTLKVNKKPYLNETMYIEFEGGWPEYDHVITQPQSTQWHEVYPIYDTQYLLEKWFDNCDSKLSYCDNITLRDKETGELAEYHVDEVKTDLIISPRVTQIIPDKTKNYIGQGFYQYIPVSIDNYYANTTTFTVYAYYDGLQPIGNQTLTLNPLESGDAIIKWTETSTWPRGTYNHTITINTYANDTLAYTVAFPITFKITMVGDLNGDGKVNVKDVYTSAKAFGSYLGHARWDPDADVNNDFKVDIKDYYIVCKNFGRTDP